MKTSMLILTLLVDGQAASAQEAPAAVAPQLVLARICAKEEGWSITDGCAGIHQVLERGSRRTGLSYVSFARQYSPSAFAPRPGKEWFSGLLPSGTRPAGWPRGASWAAHRGKWLALYRHAGAIQSGAATSRCTQPPKHWGGAMDHKRPRRYGWVRVSCGDTRNLFWIPRRESLGSGAEDQDRRDLENDGDDHPDRDPQDRAPVPGVELRDCLVPGSLRVSSPSHES